jgi:hypothetical protein
MKNSHQSVGGSVRKANKKCLFRTRVHQHRTPTVLSICPLHYLRRTNLFSSISTV